MKFITSLFVIALSLVVRVYALTVERASVSSEGYSSLSKRTCADPSLSTILYMDYNPDINDRLYTTDYDTFYFFFRHLGYYSSGNAGKAFATQRPFTVGLWQLTKTSTPRFYTSSIDEKDAALASGEYTSASVVAWIYGTQDAIPACGAVPLFHLYNPVNGDHFYTVDPATRDTYISDHGYLDKGIAGYVLS